MIIRIQQFRILCYTMALLLTINSCTKTDISSKTINDKVVIEKFLTVPAKANPVIKKIIDVIKIQEDKYQFLNKVITREGFAKWESAKIIIAPSTHKSKNINGSTQRKDNSQMDTVILVPLVLSNTTYVNSFLACKLGDSININMFRGSDYASYGFHNIADSISAKQIANTCILLEYEAFGHTTFNIKDLRLFNYMPNGQIPVKTKLKIKPEKKNKNSANRFVTLFYSYTEEVLNDLSEVACPVGQACNWTHTETFSGSFTYWVSDFSNWDGGNFPDPNPWINNNFDPCNGIPCTPVIDGWQFDQTSIADANGYLYSRIEDLKLKLAANPFEFEPCDSLNIMPLDPDNGYGLMYQRVAQFIPSQYVKSRIDSIRNEASNWMVDNFYATNINSAYGSVVNCDFFPL